MQHFLGKTQRKLFAFLMHRRGNENCERWGPTLPEAWDSLGRLVAASRKAKDEPRTYIYLFMFVMQFSVWLKVLVFL